MKNHRDLLGIAANVLIAVALLAFIILGLNKMGLYKLPSSIENIISPKRQEHTPAQMDDSNLYDSFEYDENEKQNVEKTTLTYENAKQLLENVISSESYHHEISVTHKYEDVSMSNKVVLVKKDNLYSADVYSDKGKHIETITETETDFTVKNYEEAEERQFTYPKGNFEIFDLVSVIADYDSFLGSEYQLEEADFSVFHGDFGVELEIAFDTTLDNYSQREVYCINLDYGVVSQALCYENGNLVYEMQTLILKEID